jgi:hypothetical protein
MITQIALLILAIPLGLFLASLTKDEETIYKKYFPAMLWILAILAAVFYTLNTQTALVLTFIFLMVLSWLKSTKIMEILNLK